MAHRGERVISRKAIAQGMSDVLRFTCMLMRALLVHVAHEIAGAARIRHSLRPPEFGEGVKCLANLGRNASRECEYAFSVVIREGGVTQCPRDINDQTEKPRRTGSSAGADDDGGGRGDRVPSIPKRRHQLLRRRFRPRMALAA